LSEKTPTRHLFLMHQGFHPTVIDSQVGDKIRALETEGIAMDLTACVSLGEYLRNLSTYRVRRDEFAQRIAGDVTLLPSFRPHLAPFRVAQALATRWAGIPRATERLVILARGHTAADIAIAMRRFHGDVRVVFDVRGDALAEARMEQAEAERTTAQRRAQHIAETIQRGVSGADRLFCVSERLKELLISQHGADPQRIDVFHCLADGERFRVDPALRAKVREREGLTDKEVLIFPGSVGLWHHIDASLRLVSRLMRDRPSLHFVALTPQVDAMEARLREVLPFERYRVLQAPHDAVPGWLNAADAALLLRAQHPVNAVAAPTKFAEYLLCGLPTLISDGIGDYSAFVEEHDAGILVNDDDLEGAAAAFDALRDGWTDDRRRRLSALGHAHYSKAARAPEMARILRALAD